MAEACGSRTAKLNSKARILATLRPTLKANWNKRNKGDSQLRSEKERAQELQWAMEAMLKHERETAPDDADKLLTTGWLAKAEEALQMFKEICETHSAAKTTP